MKHRMNRNEVNNMKNDEGWFLMGLIMGPIGIASMILGALLIAVAVML